MGFLNRLGDDFKHRLFQDIGTWDLVFLVVLLAVLFVSLFSKKIAMRFKETDEEVLRLSVKIKTAGLLTAAALALLIMQLY